MTPAPYDARRRPDPRGMDSLSPREREVLRSFARQGTHKAVAVELGIRNQSVKNHAHNVIRKLGVRSIAQAAVLFDRHARSNWPEIDRRSADRRTGERRTLLDLTRLGE